MQERLWKVGELAKETNVSVRTLHYYDEIGLLSPSKHTASGHRLYGRDDVIRLQQIRSLKQIGFPLPEIRAFLNRTDYSPRGVIQMHLARLRGHVEAQQKLCERLEAIDARLEQKEQVSVDEFVRTIQEIEMMEQFEKYYSPEQLQELADRRDALGEEGMRQAENDWKEVLSGIRTEMEKGTDPASETMQALARRYRGLIDAFTGGNREIEQSLRNMYRQEPNIAASHGYTPDPKMMEYVGKAMRAAQDNA